MKKQFRVTQNEVFSKVIKTGKKYYTNCFVAYYLNNNLQHSRFGISVSKKVANAVGRVKLRRQYRALIDLHKELLDYKLDIIIIVKKESIITNFQTKLDYINNFIESIKNEKKN